MVVYCALMLWLFSYERKRAQHPLKCLVCGEAFKERHHLTRHMTAHQERQSGEQTYRVTILRGNNLQLTWLNHFWQLVGRYCSYLLPRQCGGTSQT